ncbi:MAG: hypothetical protein ACREVX_00640 [Clostridium sp.]|uniref:hypothetical protein n=1 Tax=Clostridium sp. TaxID=1506 RepID=UPI003D6DA38C
MSYIIIGLIKIYYTVKNYFSLEDNKLVHAKTEKLGYTPSDVTIAPFVVVPLP